MYRILIPLRFFLLFCLPRALFGLILWEENPAPSFHLRVEIDKAKLLPGEPFTLTLYSEHPDTVDFDADSALVRAVRSSNPLNPVFDLVDYSVFSSPLEKGIVRNTRKLVLRPARTGRVLFSFLVFSFIPKDSSSPRIDLFPPVFSVEVAPLPSEPGPIPIAPLISVSEEFPLGFTLSTERELLTDRLPEEKKRVREALFRHRFPWLAAAIVAGLCGLSSILYLARRYFFPVRISPNSSTKSAPPDINAALRQLGEMHTEEKSEIERYYEKYFELLIFGIEKISKIPARTMTSGELEQHLNDDPFFSLSLKKALLRRLSIADRLKFEGVVPDGQNIREDFLFLESLLKGDSGCPDIARGNP